MESFKRFILDDIKFTKGNCPDCQEEPGIDPKDDESNFATAESFLNHVVSDLKEKMKSEIISKINIEFSY